MTTKTVLAWLLVALCCTSLVAAVSHQRLLTKIKNRQAAAEGCGCQPCPCTVQPTSCTAPACGNAPAPPQHPVFSHDIVSPSTAAADAAQHDAIETETAHNLARLNAMRHMEEDREKQIEELKEQAAKEKADLEAEMQALKKKVGAEEHNETEVAATAESAVHNATQTAVTPNVTIEVHTGNTAAIPQTVAVAQADLTAMEAKVKQLTDKLQLEEQQLHELQGMLNHPQVETVHPGNQIGFEDHQFELKLESPWKLVGHDFDVANGYLEDDLCVLGGLVQGDTGLILTLPQQCRPTNGRVIFSQMQGNKPARIDVLSDGRVYKVIGGQTGNQWVTLNGITFPTRGGEDVPLIHGWQSYGSTFRAPQVSQHGGLCVLSGTLRGNQWDYMGRVPEYCRPVGRLVFSLNNNQATSRVDILDSGYILYNGGSQDSHAPLSLDGAMWTVQGGEALKLQGKWENYGTPFRSAKFERVMDWCFVSGMVINKAQWTRYVALLPQECRPSRRLTFGVNVHLGEARVDVLPSGKIMYVSGKLSWNWLSLSGIGFTVAQEHRNEEHDSTVYEASQYNPTDEHEGQNGDVIPVA